MPFSNVSAYTYAVHIKCAFCHWNNLYCWAASHTSHKSISRIYVCVIQIYFTLFARKSHIHSHYAHPLFLYFFFFLLCHMKSVWVEEIFELRNSSETLKIYMQKYASLSTTKVESRNALLETTDGICMVNFDPINYRWVCFHVRKLLNSWNEGSIHSHIQFLKCLSWSATNHRTHSIVCWVAINLPENYRQWQPTFAKMTSKPISIVLATITTTYYG